MMDWLPAEIEAYAVKASIGEDELLKELAEVTQKQTECPQMCSGPLQGNLLYFLAKLLNAQNILEIGMFTGYSAIWMARALPDGGQLTCLEINQTYVDMANSFFRRAGLEKKIKIQVGPAMEILPTLPGPFDLIFIDADKENYLNYYQTALGLLRPGGLIIADNVLWSGRVLESLEEADPTTKALIQFNEVVNVDPQVRTMLLPLRDGLMLLQKKETHDL